MLGWAPLLLAAAASVTPRHDVASDLDALGSPRAEQRREAMERLREGLKSGDLASLLHRGREGGPSVRAAVVELLLDRTDLAAAAIPGDRQGVADPLLLDLARGAFARARPSAEEPTRDFPETISVLEEARGESLVLEPSIAESSTDRLAYELRRSGALPFPLLIDPEAPRRTVRLGESPAPAEELVFGALLRSAALASAWNVAGLAPLPALLRDRSPFVALGTERRGERVVPSLVLVDAVAGRTGSEHAGRWLALWLEETGPVAVRAGVALLDLELAPVDRAIPAALRSPDPERRRVAARTLSRVPRRGAALLGEDTRLLDAFLAIALASAPDEGVLHRRVLELLPERDAAGRSIDARLVLAVEGLDPARRAMGLEALARRRSPEALGLLRSAAASLDPRQCAAGLAGLQRRMDASAMRVALDALTRSSDEHVLRIATSIVVAAEGGPEAAASLAEGLQGLGRAAILGVQLHARDATLREEAVARIAATTDPRSLDWLAETARSASLEIGVEPLVAALRPAVDAGAWGATVVASLAGLVDETSRFAVLRRCLASAYGADEALALRAFGASATAAEARSVLGGRVADPALPLESRRAALEGFREFLRRDPAPGIPVLPLPESAIVQGLLASLASRLGTGGPAGDGGAETLRDDLIRWSGVAGRALPFPRPDVDAVDAP